LKYKRFFFHLLKKSSGTAYRQIKTAGNHFGAYLNRRYGPGSGILEDIWTVVIFIWSLPESVVKIAVQTHGDFLNFNPHLHAIVSDGYFLDDSSFRRAPGFILEDLEKIFQYEVLT
jgi:hypothetical protein